MPKRRASAARWIPPAKNMFQFKITLKYIRPPIWRRLLVPDNLSLGELHQIIQVTMGWTNSHLHAFHIGLLEYGRAGDDEEVGSSVADEDSTLLKHLSLIKGKKFTYDYDFGDGWVHEIRVEKVQPAGDLHPRPSCLGGERACPPEDCGGVPGYENVLRVLKRARTKDDREFKEWIGDYDPESFDVDNVNEFLRG